MDENAEIDSAKFWNFGFWKIWVREKSTIATSKPKIELRFWIWGIEIQNPSQKIQNSAAQNLKFGFEFEFPYPKFDFENLQIAFSNSFRISIRDHQIWNRHHRKPLNLDFRFKIQIFLRPKSWFCFRYHHYDDGYYGHDDGHDWYDDSYHHGNGLTKKKRFRTMII